MSFQSIYKTEMYQYVFGTEKEKRKFMGKSVPDGS